MPLLTPQPLHRLSWRAARSPFEHVPCVHAMPSLMPSAPMPIPATPCTHATPAFQQQPTHAPSMCSRPAEARPAGAQRRLLRRGGSLSCGQVRAVWLHGQHPSEQACGQTAMPCVAQWLLDCMACLPAPHAHAHFAPHALRSSCTVPIPPHAVSSCRLLPPYAHALAPPLMPCPAPMAPFVMAGHSSCPLLQLHKLPPPSFMPAAPCQHHSCALCPQTLAHMSASPSCRPTTGLPECHAPVMAHCFATCVASHFHKALMAPSSARLPHASPMPHAAGLAPLWKRWTSAGAAAASATQQPQPWPAAPACILWG